MNPRRKPIIFWKLVERENAIRYLMISLFSFVATVGVVRTFLALTGYPQLGSGSLHIAHVLWGGLILYIAAILPLVYLNPRLHSIGAVLSGIGMGLFLDEVGKFITSQYDYFFPAAAPIIYVFFLLIVILAVMIQRPNVVDGRAELVKALEIVREQLYRPLDAMEKAHVEADLTYVIEKDDDSLHQDMAKQLLGVIHADMRIPPIETPAWWWRAIERIESWLTEKRLSSLLIVGFLVVSLLTLKNPFQAWLERIYPNSSLLAFLSATMGRSISSVEAPALSNLRLILEVFIGVALLVSAIMIAIGKKRIAVNLGFLSLLMSVAILDLLLFYFEQFSTIVIVLVQFLVLFGVIYYRREYLHSKL